MNQSRAYLYSPGVSGTSALNNFTNLWVMDLAAFHEICWPLSRMRGAKHAEMIKPHRMDVANVLASASVDEITFATGWVHSHEGIKLLQVFERPTRQAIENAFKPGIYPDEVVSRIFERERQLRRHQMTRIVVGSNDFCYQRSLRGTFPGCGIE